MDIRKTLEDVIAPGLQAINGKMEAVDTRIGALHAEMRSELHRLDEKVGNLDKRLSERIDGLDDRLSGKIDGLDERLSGKMSGLEENIRHTREDFRMAIDMHERIAKIEVKLAMNQQPAAQ